MGVLHFLELLFESLNFEPMFFLINIAIETSLRYLFSELSDSFVFGFELLFEIGFNLAAELFFEEFLVGHGGKGVF